MASDDKKRTYNKNKYIKELREGKSTYEKRKQFLASFSLPKTKEQLAKEAAAKAKAGGGTDTGNAVQDEGLASAPDDPNGIFALAKSKMGAPYVFGAAGPNTFDCSGFVCWVYNKSGYKFGRDTAAGYYNTFQHVTDPKPGDLVFFSGTYKPGVSHIGIYMGNNTMIHTANKRHGVQISELTGYYKQKFTGYARIQDKYKTGASKSTEEKKEAKKSSIQATEVVEEVIGDDVTLPPLEDEGGYIDLTIPTYPYNPVRFVGDSMIQANDTRSAFLHNRVGWARTKQYTGFESLNKELFIHQEHYDGYEGNLYSPDAKKVFENLLLKTRKPYFEVISGFRFSNPGQISPHEAGCAMDILVRDIDEVREIADCAWQLGVRSIAIGGDFMNQKGFIHLDIAPKGVDFMYDGIPIYGGPGKWVTK